MIRKKAAQDIIGIVFRAIVDNNYLIFRIILFQNGWQEFPEVFSFVSCTNDNGNRLLFSFFFCRMPVKGYCKIEAEVME